MVVEESSVFIPYDGDVDDDSSYDPRMMTIPTTIPVSEWDRRQLVLRNTASSSSNDNNNNNPKCGTPLTRRIDVSKISPNCQDTSSCERVYVLYLPSSACDSNGIIIQDDTTTTPSSSSSSSILPLVFAIHCLGCTPSTMMHWTQIAEAYSFVLAIPEGIHHSFNAGIACCGSSLIQNVDDVGFFQTIIQYLSIEFPSLISSELVYGLGWSNGGYMVSSTAYLFRAIAPISGFQVDLNGITKPTGVFLHHSQDDQFVQMTGCCTDPTMPKCCCHLSNADDTCTTLEEKAIEWSTTINGCSSTVPIVTYESPDDVMCYTFENCQANTTYCIHQNKGHFNRPSHAAAFSMSHDIADFFARDACSINGGQFIVENPSQPPSAATGAAVPSMVGTCHCTNNSQEGVYCWGSSSTTTTTNIQTSTTNPPLAEGGSSMNLDKKQSLDGEMALENMNSATEQRSATVVILMVVLVTIGIVFYYYYRGLHRQMKRYAGFSKVSTVEMRAM